MSQGLVSIDGRVLVHSISPGLIQFRKMGIAASSNDWMDTQDNVNASTLSPSPHTLAIDAFNNKKTLHDEATEMLLDDILIQR